MKKYILTVALALLGAAAVLNAVPAKPGKYLYIQPDGSAIYLHGYGDEFYHWTTDDNGTVVEMDNEGYFVMSTMPVEEHFGGRAAAARQAAAIRARRAAQSRTRSATVYHFPVILVNLKNVKIQGTVQNVTFQSATPGQDFYNLLNQQGYSANGGTGSVHDYYWDNSMGTFDAQFDVYGPYDYNASNGTVSDDPAAAKILWSVIKAHDADVDWSQYDNDGDGYVDMVFMYYAGKNSAEGASGTIWPHKWNMAVGSNEVYSTYLDGKRFDVYACTSELSRGAGNVWGMCGIGTCAHEFAHTQGLPDFYDTNNSETTVWDGDAGATYHYDIMCSGNYNNNGRTPPYFTAEERMLMGWLGDLEDIPASGTVTIPALSTNYAGRLMTTNRTGDGEYFVLECRSGSGWDAPLQPGLLVYHVDKSTRYSNQYHSQAGDDLGNMTGYELWSSWRQFINANGSHPCCYVIPAADPTNLNYTQGDANLPFPGAAGVTHFIPSDWAGNTYGVLDGIAFNASGTYQGVTCPVVTLSRGVNFKGVTGTVTNMAGETLAGATVSVYSSSPLQSPPSSGGIQLISGRISDRLLLQTTTDANGQYTVNLSSVTVTSVGIEVAASGYITRYESISLSGDNLVTKDFVIRPINLQTSSELSKITALTGFRFVGIGSGYSLMAAIHFTAEELAPYAGRKILDFGFAYNQDDGATIDGVYGVMELNEARTLFPMSDTEPYAWNVMDVSAADYRIPTSGDAYFGYALENCVYNSSEHYPPIMLSDETYQSGGFNYTGLSASYDLSTYYDYLSWTENSNFGNLLVFVELEDAASVAYNTIANPGYGTYQVGDSFALELDEVEGDRKPGSAVQWFFDDEPVSGASVTLRYPGVHVVEARFTTTGGNTKVVELEINVNP